MIRTEVLGKLAADLRETWTSWSAVFDPTEAEEREAKRQVILALGGVELVEGLGRQRERDVLSMTRMDLHGLSIEGAAADQLLEMFDQRGWTSHPGMPLSRWLKVADRATLLKVQAIMKDLGHER